MEQAEKAAQDLYGRFVFGQFLLLLETWSRSSLSPMREDANIDPKYDRIAGVLTYLKSHRCEKLRLEDVAKAFFISPCY